MPGHQQGPGAAAAALAAPATLVLSRAVKAGHEQAFEDVLHRLAAEVRRQPGHLDLTVLAPQPGGPCIYTIVSHFAGRAPVPLPAPARTARREPALNQPGPPALPGRASTLTLLGRHLHLSCRLLRCLRRPLQVRWGGK